MAYERFAYLYDELMEDSPYDEWERFIESRVEAYRSPGQKLLDIGCGTGELAVRLAKAGYDVTGVDLSTEMLTVADSKASENQLEIQFYEQDMRELNLPEQFDIITIMCDSLNYLETLDDIKATFKRVNEHLNEEGLFIIDVHSLYKINQIFKNHEFTYNEEKLSYIWECFEGPYEDSVYHDLTFFVQTPSGLYEKVEETHIQRTWDKEKYLMCLQEASLDIVDVCADFTEEVSETSERLFFTAKKRRR